MSAHAYPASALAADFARGGIGFALTALPLLFLPLHWIAALLFGGASVLFGMFLIRTVQRQLTVIEATDSGIACRGPGGRSIPWSELAGLRLSYYSTRRDRENGWMTLVLKGGGRSVSLDSTISAFDAVVRRAHAAADANGLALSDATLNNLMVMGVVRPATGLAERWGPDPEEDGAPDGCWRDGSA